MHSEVVCVVFVHSEDIGERWEETILIGLFCWAI